MAEDSGGYDEGYRAVPCFWGEAPGSLVRQFLSQHNVEGLRVLDLGAGEGKNAAALASCGASVDAVELSPFAIDNGVRRFGGGFNWVQADVLSLSFEPASYDLIISYGLAHCIRSERHLDLLIEATKTAVRPGGYYILVTFNNRTQDLRAHAGFAPLLLPHDWYLRKFSGWDILHASDEVLEEIHPHNNIPHHHSMTRLLVRRTLHAHGTQ